MLKLLKNMTARVKSTWVQGPCPCWEDYLQETADKR